MKSKNAKFLACDRRVLLQFPLFNSIPSAIRYFLLFTFSFLLINSCKSDKENLAVTGANEYFPLQTGKYLTYQTDSLVWISFGTRDTTISYQVKYEVDALITDNNGKPAYRVFRYIRKNATQSWLPQGTCMAMNTGNNIEWVENNMRFIKLTTPVEEGKSWKGNSYIDTYSANSDLHYMDNWDFTYQMVGSTYNTGTLNFDNTLTVQQRDEVVGLPDNPDSYSEINFSQEKYALGIGLIYRQFNHKEYQPNNGGYVAEGSYGITMRLIDYN